MLQDRLSVHGQSCGQYLERLACAPEAEFAALATALTVGETYFLRHAEQFEALSAKVVPDLLRRPGQDEELRMLSAGCASGEEAYSLAIVLRGTTTAGTRILGVDVNPEALRKARSGRYSAWSLRAMPASVRRHWFTAEGDQLVLADSLRSAVRFEPGNLADDDPRLWRPGGYDVVFCRNVLMYLTAETMTRAVRRIYGSLSPGGYLFLGSAETLRGIDTDFELRESHGTFYYQREGQPAGSARQQPPAGGLRGTRRAKAPVRIAAGGRLPGADQARTIRPGANPGAGGADSTAPLLQLALQLLGRGRAAEALAIVNPLLDSTDHPEVLLLHAALAIHEGDLGSAGRSCRRLIDAVPGSGGEPTGEADRAQLAGAHMLLGICLENGGNLPGAIAQHRAAIETDPQFAMPHLHLARLTRRDGDAQTSRQEFGAAIGLLATETEHRILLFGGGFDRDGLIALCRNSSQAIGGRR